MGRACSEKVSGFFKMPTCKPAGKRSLGRRMRKWDAIFRMDLEEIGVNTRNWVDSTQDRSY
jgi:hypothetical protein